MRTSKRDFWGGIVARIPAVAASSPAGATRADSTAPPATAPTTVFRKERLPTTVFRKERLPSPPPAAVVELASMSLESAFSSLMVSVCVVAN